ncbi:MAG: XrtA system polysaccharide deacetylase [Syntrophobacteraceae bacterium]
MMSGNRSNVRKHILLTIDVEDWFQVENFKSYIPFSSWPSCESRVEHNTHRLLDLLDATEGLPGSAGPIRATFFVLGWLANRIPHLVREISRRGHEVASHGYNHDLCTHLPFDALRKDLADSKQELENIVGKAVNGYRAPSFSVNGDVLTILAECGYSYDSSYNSFRGNSRYGRLDLVRNGNGIASKLSPGLYELPISNLRLGNRVIPTGGGGYFRLIPAPLFNRAARYILNMEKAFLFYMHPWEIDPEQPKVKQAPAVSRFRHYVNLNKTLPRLKNLVWELSGCRFVSCHDYLMQVCSIGSNSAA